MKTEHYIVSIHGITRWTE